MGNFKSFEALKSWVKKQIAEVSSLDPDRNPWVFDELKKTAPTKTDTRVKLILTDDKGRVLLLRDTYSGGKYWDLPGGGVLSNQTDEEALREEVKDETGLELPEKVSFLGAKQVPLSGTSKGPGYMYNVKFYRAQIPEIKSAKISPEHTGWDLVNPQDLGDYNLGAYQDTLKNWAEGKSFSEKKLEDYTPEEWAKIEASKEKATGNTPKQEAPQQKTKGKIAYHEHEGYPLHPVSVKHHQEYFTTHPGAVAGVEAIELPKEKFDKLGEAYSTIQVEHKGKSKEEQIKIFVEATKQNLGYSLEEAKTFLNTLGTQLKIAPDKMQETFSMLEEAWGEEGITASINNKIKEIREQYDGGDKIVEALKEAGVNWPQYKEWLQQNDIGFTAWGILWHKKKKEEETIPPEKAPPGVEALEEPKPPEIELPAWTKNHTIDEILEQTKLNSLSSLFGYGVNTTKGYAEGYLAAQAQGKGEEFFKALKEGAKGKFVDKVKEEIEKLTEKGEFKPSSTLVIEQSVKDAKEKGYQNVFKDLKEAGYNDKEATDLILAHLKDNYNPNDKIQTIKNLRGAFVKIGLSLAGAKDVVEAWGEKEKPPEYIIDTLPGYFKPEEEIKKPYGLNQEQLDLIYGLRQSPLLSSTTIADFIASAFNIPFSYADKLASESWDFGKPKQDIKAHQKLLEALAQFYTTKNQKQIDSIIADIFNIDSKTASNKMKDFLSSKKLIEEGGKKPSSSEEIYQSAKNLFESLAKEKGINEAKQIITDLKEKGVSFQDFIRQYKKVYEEAYNIPLSGEGMKEFWDSSPGEEIKKPAKKEVSFALQDELDWLADSTLDLPDKKHFEEKIFPQLKEAIGEAEAKDQVMKALEKNYTSQISKKVVNNIPFRTILESIGFSQTSANSLINHWATKGLTKKLDISAKEPPEWTKEHSLEKILDAVSRGNLSGLMGKLKIGDIDKAYIDAFFVAQAQGKEADYWDAWDKRKNPDLKESLVKRVKKAGGVVNLPTKTLTQEEANKILEKEWPDVTNGKMSVQAFYSGLKNSGVTKELLKKFLEDRGIIGIKTIMEDYDEFSGKKIEPILTPQKVNIAPSKSPFTEEPKLITSTSGYNYKFIKSLGGSHPGGQYENTKTGEKNYIKFPSPEQAKYEYLTNLLYKLAGVLVNNMELLNAGVGKLGVKTEWLEGKNMLPPEELISSPDVMKNFVFDAWLGNYDVLGTDYSNILKSGNHFFRIDQGSGLIFRARGAKKEFGPEVKELETFLDPNINREGSKVFGGVPKEALKEFNKWGAKKLSKITDTQIDHILGSVAITVADRKQLSTTLKARRDYIVKKVLGKASKEPLPYPLTLKKGKPKGVGYFLSKNKLTKALWDKKIGNKLEVEDIAREYGVEKEFKTIQQASSSWQSGNREGQIKIRAAIAKLSGREHDQYLNDSQYYIYDSQKSSVEFEEAFKSGIDNASGILPLIKKSQNYLKGKYPQGSITVYRGLSGTISERIRKAHNQGAKTITMPNDGHSGWSPSKSVAHSFGNVIFTKKVPIEAIWIDFNSFSSSYTSEKELIVDSSYTEIFNRDEVEIS